MLLNAFAVIGMIAVGSVVCAGAVAAYLYYWLCLVSTQTIAQQRPQR